MVTSFADGSKISFEQSIVANATGFTVLQRGMSRGLEYRGDVMEIGSLYDVDRLRELGGVVDYVVGTPLTKVYCLAEHTDPKQQHYLELYKLGKGPLYAFFVPYHLVHFEVPFAIARVALFRDSVAKPLAGPVVEVCAVAKRDLQAGEVLDGPGMYMTYGEAASADEMSERRYLPEGLVAGCILRRDVGRDEVLSYDDVDLPAGRLADRLRAEQLERFRGETWLAELLGRDAPVASGSPARRGRERRVPLNFERGRADSPAYGLVSASSRITSERPPVKVVIFCGGLGVRMGEETQQHPEADDPDRQPADPLAHHELVRGLGAPRLRPVPRPQGRGDQGVLPPVQRDAVQRLRARVGR